MGGPPFRFMLPQQGLGEHPLSPGMPLLISAAINQFSSSHQPHIHPPHLVLPFLSTSLLPLGSFYSALVCSPQRFSALNRSRGRLRSSWPTSTFLFDVNGAGFFVNVWNHFQLDLKPRSADSMYVHVCGHGLSIMLKHLFVHFTHTKLPAI